MYIIAKDGSGDFASIQEAIDAIPGGGRAPTILILRMDEYHERVIVNKDNVRIIGEARDRTVITNAACAGEPNPDGAYPPFTMLVTGSNVEVENLTIRGDAGQAVAVCAAGDRGVWRNCRMIGGQSALVCGPLTRGRQYLADCAIQGGVDFGSHRCWLERCAEYSTREERTLLEVIGGWDNWRPDQRVPTWFLCGDSTMANYPADKAPMTGWGQKLQALLTDNVYVENCAVNGRSSKSFVAEKRLNFIELCLRKGDKLIISFSHNDEKPDPERSTHPRMTFPNYLGMYIDAARRQGAEPILVTPIARRHFDGEGRLIPTHGAYPDAMRNLAEYRGVRLIDLEKATMRMCRLAGAEGTKEIFCHVPAGHPNYPDGIADNSHLQESGASRIAGLFLSRMNNPGMQEESFENVAADDCSDLIAREDSVLR